MCEKEAENALLPPKSRSRRGRVSKPTEIWVWVGFTINLFCFCGAVCGGKPFMSPLAPVPVPLKRVLSRALAPGSLSLPTSEHLPRSERAERVINSFCQEFESDECDQQTIPMSVAPIKTLLGAEGHAEKLMRSNFSPVSETYWC